MVAAFFLAAEPVAGVNTKPGIFLTVILGGIMAFIFRSLCGEPYGVIYAILFVNLITPLIRILESSGFYIKFKELRVRGRRP